MTDVILGEGVTIDLPTLVETRLLVQSNSGGGKSYTIRRLLEQTHGKIQQIVLDLEGEFATLREHFDYIICGKGGDTPAEPKSAKLLARKLLDLRVSAICDLSELPAHDRVRFVRYFLEALVAAPRDTWHPVLVVVDEAHHFCPEKGQAESAPAMIDLATRGRKRGLCAIFCTQRLAKLHKDATAELLNKLIGRTGQDIDQRRAADELGIADKADRLALRDLEPGQFFAFGPAISRSVVKVQVGEVVSRHPKVGERGIEAPPPPNDAMRAVLAKLADLPGEAEREARDIASLTAQVTQLRRELAAKPKPEATQADIDNAVRDVRVEYEGRLQATERAKDVLQRQIKNAIKKLTGHAAGLGDGLAALAFLVEPGGEAEVDVVTARAHLPEPVERGPETRPRRDKPEVYTNGHSIDGLKAGAVRILREIASRYPATWTKSQVGALTGFTPSGGTFQTYIGDLRRRGLIEVRGNEVIVTDAGLSECGDVPPAPTSHTEIMEMWRRALKAGCYKMLEVIAEAGESGIDRGMLADATEFTASGGTFQTYLGILRRNGLIRVDGQTVTAESVLWPEGVPA